jgi:curved DNA-binding protein CbpA
MVELKQAWRRAMLRYHPDRAAGDKKKQAEFTQRSQEINWAYQLLKNRVSVGAQV